MSPLWQKEILKSSQFLSLVLGIVTQVYFMLNPQLGLWVALLRDMDNRGSPGYCEAHPVCHVGVYTYMYLRQESYVFLTMMIKLWLANF